jgi:SAM-dependent methyltransferase
MTARSAGDALALRRDRVCLICGAVATPIGRAESLRDKGTTYEMATCDQCGFSFVVEPRTDFENLYDAGYYRGAGFDPSVDYAAERDEQTVRVHEWDGVWRVVQSLHPRPVGAWLDYGCGYGGLVAHLRRMGVEAVGHDIGHPAAHARASGIPIVDESQLFDQRSRYDVITAIEVIEHTIDPIELLATFAELLAPGGLVFLTTGNAARHRNSLTTWRYVAPEVHVSYFEPRTLRRAYEAVGLLPVEVGRRPGMSQILQYKMLKVLGSHRRTAWHRFLPWPVLARLADRREGVSAQPAAMRPPTDG